MDHSNARATMIEPATHRGDLRGTGPNQGLTVIVATYQRPRLLEKLLISLRSEVGFLREVVVSSPRSADATEAVVAAQSEFLPMLRLAHSTSPVKSTGLNAAIRGTDGPYLAFLDDDIEVEPGWAEAFLAQLRTPGAVAFQGRISAPSCLRDQPPTAEKARSFTTHPFLDYGPRIRPCRSLTGANCAVHRATFDRVGTFDERLGPGASGACEDTDLGFRIRRAGGVILYTPRAEVVHSWFPERATEAYYTEYLERRGRSRWLMKGRPAWPRVLGDMLWTHVMEFVSRASSDPNLRLLRRSRCIHYSAMWKCARAARRGSPG